MSSPTRSPAHRNHSEQVQTRVAREQPSPPSPERGTEGRFSFPLRVYYEDTDAAGVVYYANYLRYLERGRTEWLRALGIEQSWLAQETGLVFAVRSINIEYLKPARLDDELAVLSRQTLLGRAQITMEQRIERGGETLVEASVRIACLDARKMKPAALPAHIRERLSQSQQLMKAEAE